MILNPFPIFIHQLSDNSVKYLYLREFKYKNNVIYDVEPLFTIQMNMRMIDEDGTINDTLTDNTFNCN